MERINHYIVTRYNVGMYGNTPLNHLMNRYQEHHSVPLLEKNEWMNDRLHIFEHFCLPSVIGQKNQDFQWLILLDERTPGEFIDSLFMLLSPYENIRMVFTNYTPNYMHLQRLILQNISSKDNLLLTRLDNDDIILPEFVEKTQDFVKSLMPIRYPKIINYPLGYNYNYENKKWYFTGVDGVNTHFMSVFGRGIALYSQYANICGSHVCKKHEIKDRLWVRVIHRWNIFNRITNDDVKCGEKPCSF